MLAAPPDLEVDLAPLLKERHVALAVSGGSDSVALMRLVQAWARENHPGLSLSVLTVDHGLRAEAKEEAAEVARWAGDLGLSHHTLTWSPEHRPSTGIQARARAARYGLMAEWCRANGAGLLLTAHTLDDQAETVLMRLARTLSPDSLAGIRAHGAWDGLPLFRPLLGVRRQALRDYLSTLGQAWVDDPSNDDRRYERVRVRQALALPETHSITPERLAALAEAGARTSELLARLSARWTLRWLKEEGAGVCYLPLDPLRGLPEPLQQRLLGVILRHYGGGRLEPDAEELRRAVRWVLSGEGPPRSTLAGSLMGRRKDALWVTREAGRIAPGPLAVPAEGRILWDGRFLVEAPAESIITPAGSRKIDLGQVVPAAARQAYPWVELPPGASGPAKITFLRLNPP